MEEETRELRDRVRAFVLAQLFDAQPIEGQGA